MKKLLILVALLLSSCGGGGGGDSATSPFNFRGLWVASLSLIADTCQSEFSAGTGAFPFVLNQSGNVVSLSDESSDVQVVGFAEENSVTLVGATPSPLPICSSNVEGETVTISLSLAETSGDVSGNTTLTYFFDCPVRSESCEFTYSGNALRVSGEESTSGLVPVLPSENTEPSIFLN